MSGISSQTKYRPKTETFVPDKQSGRLEKVPLWRRLCLPPMNIDGVRVAVTWTSQTINIL